MKVNQIKKLIKYIVAEAVDIMREEHDTGEWWIDESGQTTYCDNTVTDQGHEAVVIGYLIHEILSHFGIEEDEPGKLSNYEESIKENLIEDGRLSEEELEEWNTKSPSEIILRKLVEDGAYKDPKQAEDALYIAYGSSSRDARDYAMRYWNWKVMKTSGDDIEIQTWHLKPEDIGIIVRGIWEIMGEDTDDEEDPDSVVGDDKYPGPRINVTVQASGKRFSDVPLAVLEKKMPQELHNYQSGAHVGYTENLTEDFHHLHKEYRLYEGNSHIVAIFEDNSRLMFEVHYHNNHGEDKEKHRHQAFTTWKSLANEIHGDVQLNEVGNPIQKSWKKCFKEALKHPKLQEYIRKPEHQRVFDDDDKGYPTKVQRKPQPCIDPVNFTPRG